MYALGLGVERAGLKSAAAPSIGAFIQTGMIDDD